MPRDPAVFEEAENVLAALSITNLLAAFAFKLPSFWPDNIQTWLIQSKLQFHLKGVTCSQTKFDFVVQAMSSLMQSWSWISSELLLPLILIDILKTGFSACMP